ncbi:MAG: aldo/keto reductase [Bacteroidetes bacterium]|nr:aldo/keto reductase [Bacteroidota bacterium]
MKYRSLGSSDLKISEISFGCMSLGKDQSQNSRLLRSAFERGVNFFDTADLYDRGENEISVGKALAGIRSKVILASKVGNQWSKEGSGWNWNPSNTYILKAIDESLKRLNTDHIDLYQLHGGTMEDPIDETIEAFERLQDQGKIRYYGISSIRPNVIREYVNRSNMVSVMMQYSLLDRRPEEQCLDLLYENGISVLARGSLAKGLLAGKPPTGYLDHSINQVDKAAKLLHSMLTDGGFISHLALQFVLAHPVVASAVVGQRNFSQLEELMQYVNTPALSDTDFAALRKSIKAHNYQQHR